MVCAFGVIWALLVPVAPLAADCFGLLTAEGQGYT